MKFTVLVEYDTETEEYRVGPYKNGKMEGVCIFVKLMSVAKYLKFFFKTIEETNECFK